jgi:metal transporter CNNM
MLQQLSSHCSLLLLPLSVPGSLLVTLHAWVCMDAVAVVAVVSIAGVMSGLTLGLLSMDRLDLELMLRTGSKKQERFARR